MMNEGKLNTMLEMFELTYATVAKARASFNQGKPAIALEQSQKASKSLNTIIKFLDAETDLNLRLRQMRKENQ